MRHRDVHVGNFFLGEKDGEQELTCSDEEVLDLFASQVATGSASARTYRDERQARTDLEDLIETSPVGVVVFDGRGGRLRSFNREARRIVECLHLPGRELEELPDVVTVRRSDRDEITLVAFPIAQQLSSTETLRTEEITLSVPDARSVTTQVNATAIRSAEGGVESTVVTIQDLVPLEDLERMRAEFLGMVNQGLRTPLSSSKGLAVAVLGAPGTPDPS